jgi:hypothetical protein
MRAVVGVEDLRQDIVTVMHLMEVAYLEVVVLEMGLFVQNVFKTIPCLEYTIFFFQININ